MMREHVMRYKEGYSIKTCSNMYQKTTFMCHRKLGGKVVVTFKARVVEKWANSLDICPNILRYLNWKRDRETLWSFYYHTEVKGRSSIDEKDRAGHRSTRENE